MAKSQGMVVFGAEFQLTPDNPSRFMDPNRWKQIDKLVDAALDLPESERKGFVLSHSKGDDDLQKAVLDLLAVQEHTGVFLQQSAMKIAAQAMAEDSPSARSRSLAGQTIATYKIEKLLGAGGMGEVYLAHDAKLSRKVALKILPAEFVADAERTKRFEREARTISALNHPYIVTIYDVGASNGISFIATEFVEGVTVRELISNGSSFKQTLSVISQTCEALAAAHKAGIIHRDIKPENIMVRPDGFVKVLDFGLAKLGDQTELQQSLSNYTMKGIIIGTPAYMSPEQVTGERVDHRTDLWSVGVVLYEMLTGSNPFKGESRQATFQKILSEEPAAGAFPENMPAGINSIISKALEKDADVSYQTAADLLADLRRVRREIDSSPSLRSGALAPKSEAGGKSRYQFLVPAFGILILALIGVGGWFLAFRQNEPAGADWSKATNIQLTSEPGTEFYPSLSPDGKTFVYASYAAGNFDLYIQRVGGKNATNLTKDSAADDVQPAFSPSGEQIAFRSEREPKGIYVMGASGENLRHIANDGFHPAWSPDGREIVVSTFGRDQPTVRPNGEQSLLIINVETAEKRELVKALASFPAWSPSGKRIAYWFYAGAFGKREIATIPAEGGEPVIVAKDFSVSNWNPVWSPDGRFLYFVSSKDGSINFWRVRLDETTGTALSEPERIGTPSKFSRHLNFSRDGQRMIYVQTNNQTNIQGVSFDAAAGKTIGVPYWITQGDREIARAELSPDGSRFAMRMIRRVQDDIVTVGRNGRDWRDVTDDEPFDRYVRWSPDGKQLAFYSDRNGGTEIWMCNVDGTNLRQITFATSGELGSGFPVWSPDGKRLAYFLGGQTYILDLSKDWNEQTPQKLELVPGVTGFVAWDWSPDGKKLAGTIYDGSLKFIGFYSFETANYKKIVENNDSLSSWLSDSRRIIYGLDNKILIADTGTRVIGELVSDSKEHLRDPFVSRDGKLLYYTATTSESDIWLLDLSQNP